MGWEPTLSGTKYVKVKVYLLPMLLDQQVARLRLAKRSKDQADYNGVPVDNPYKPDHYRN